MIVNHSQTFAICTPAKMGTMSLEAMLIDQTGLCYRLPTRHRLEKPDFECERILITRSPLEKIISAFHYLRKRKDSKDFLWQTFNHNTWQEDVNDFVEGWFKRREEDIYPVYNYVNSENAYVFEPHLCFRVEDGFTDLLEHLGIDARIPHRNASKDRVGVDAWLNCLSMPNFESLYNWCQIDVEWYPEAIQTMDLVMRV